MPETPPNWPQQLAPGNPDREAAVGRLRTVLIKGLSHGLRGSRRPDPAFIEDITQVALVRILERLDSFNGRSAFTTWAMAIALRLAFSELRRREWRNLPLESLSSSRDPLNEIPDHGPGPDDQSDTRHINTLLHSLIQTELTSRQRDVLVAELNNMPQDEIARQLGSNRNAVYKLGYDARQALKRALENRGLSAADFFKA